MDSSSPIRESEKTPSPKMPSFESSSHFGFFNIEGGSDLPLPSPEKTSSPSTTSPNVENDPEPLSGDLEIPFGDFEDFGDMGGDDFFTGVPEIEEKLIGSSSGVGPSSQAKRKKESPPEDEDEDAGPSAKRTRKAESPIYEDLSSDTESDPKDTPYRPSSPSVETTGEGIIAETEEESEEDSEATVEEVPTTSTSRGKGMSAKKRPGLQSVSEASYATEDSHPDYPPFPLDFLPYKLRLSDKEFYDPYDPCLEDARKYKGINHPSNVSEAEFKNLRELYLIPKEFLMRRPKKDERIYHTPPVAGKRRMYWHGISVKAFQCGLRFPLNPLLREFFLCTRLALGQLTINSHLLLNAFVAHCCRRGYPTDMTYFWYVHYIKPCQSGYYPLTRRAGRGDWVDIYSHLKQWQSKWIYVAGPGLDALPRWGLINSSDFNPKEMKRMRSRGDFEEFAKRNDFENVWPNWRIGKNDFLIKYRGKDLSCRVGRIESVI